MEEKKNDNSEDKRDLEERAFNFSVGVINFLKTIRHSKKDSLPKRCLIAFILLL